MGGRYYTRATKLAGLAEIAAERGADLHGLMVEVGLEAAALRSPETAIDYAAFCELLRRCAMAWDLPDLGLRMACRQQIDFLGPVALVTRMESMFRGALQAIIANWSSTPMRPWLRSRRRAIRRRSSSISATMRPGAGRTPSS